MQTPSSVSLQTILLVDDRPENLIALEALLESPERRLLKAANGNEALTMALKNDISLILLDVQMPDMDGFEVAELLRRNAKTRQVPLIFCTAISKEKKYISRGFDAGAADYLFKPIDPDLLTAKVRVFLDLDMQRRKLQQTLLQLHRVQQENERLLRAMGEGVMGVDKNGLITSANPAAATLLGIEAGRLVGERLDKLVFLDATGRLLWTWAESPLLRTVAQGEPFQTTETFCRHDGAGVAVEITATAMNDRDKPFSGAVLVIREGARERSQQAVQERRRHPRRRLSTELTVFDRSTGSNVGRLANLSEGGVRLVVKKGFAAGQRFTFSLVLPQMIRGSTTMSFDAVAVWSESVAQHNGDILAGFRFVDLKPESLELVRYLIEKY
ncbi:MAG: response regulator [Pseudomonadota bacterium]